MTAIAAWAKDNLIPGGSILSEGLDGFRAVTKAGCSHQVFVAGGKKPKERPVFHGVNTVLGNLKTSLAGTYQSVVGNCARLGGRVLSIHSRAAAEKVLDILDANPCFGTAVLH